jgi:hypothetical protein
MIFLTLIILTALVISGVAAFFSVSGLGSLFAGAFIPVVIMASALEIGKLVTASFLTRYWDKLSFLFKLYFTGAVVTLILITSAGIYGFLTAAYQTTADQFSIINQQISILDLKKQRFQEQLDLYISERQTLSSTIEQLSSGLANNTIQYVDQETGQLITTTSSANRNALQQQLSTANEERSVVSQRIEELTDSITSLDVQVIEINANNEVAAEIGPLRYLSNLTGLSMDKVVNIFALLIVFVFDPLAVTLIIAYNKITMDKNREKTAISKEDIQDRVYEYPDSEWSTDWVHVMDSKSY